MNAFRLVYILSFLVMTCSAWQAIFSTGWSMEVEPSSNKLVTVFLSEMEDDIIDCINDRSFLKVWNSDEDVLKIQEKDEIKFYELTNKKSGNGSSRVKDTDRFWKAEFNVTGISYGTSTLRVMITRQNSKPEFFDGSIELSVEHSPFEILIVRINNFIMILVVVAWGTLMDVSNIKQVFRESVGFRIFLIGRFVFMPLASYAIGKIQFEDYENPDLSHALSLGAFLVGLSPNQEYSIIFAILFGSNVDLPILMTIVAFLGGGIITPFWIFLLESELNHEKILIIIGAAFAFLSITLLVSLTVGYQLKNFSPTAANYLKRHSKTLVLLDLILICCLEFTTAIRIFATTSWPMIVALFRIQWHGIFFGLLASKLFKLSVTETIAVTLEVGFQTGEFFGFLLSEEYLFSSLPNAKSSENVVRSVSLLAWIPLFAALSYYITKKLEEWYINKPIKFSKFYRKPVVATAIEAEDEI